MQFFVLKSEFFVLVPRIAYFTISCITFVTATLHFVKANTLIIL